MSATRPVRRALISVANKDGLVPFARALTDRGVEVVSSGTTASVLREAGVPVTPVADVTGFPEMLDGRVKTLHPRIHAAILADRRKPEHERALEDHGIEPFDLVVVSLYPFRETAASGAAFDEVIEQIDIGGPTLVRAAAKNFESVAVVVTPAAYGRLLEEVERDGGTTRETRLALARAAFAHVRDYDDAISAWFDAQAGADGEELPARLTRAWVRREALRYGENPHQRGALYASEDGPGPLGGAEVLQGKEMSFNNWLDAEAARALAGALGRNRRAAVIVKHHNPCGVALAGTLADAYERALEGDRVSAFGGIVAFNAEVDEDAARAMAPVFTEVVVAPAFTRGALALFAEKQNLRVLRAPLPEAGGLEVRPIDGGALVQGMDAIMERRADMTVATGVEPTDEQWEDLLLAWTVAARTKSNAVVLVRDLATVGVGAGQMNRVTSVGIAARQAGDRAKGSAMASDAFFPFRDSVDAAGDAGVAAIVQPGGSVRDAESIAAAEEHGIAMVLTGRRHFRH